MHAPLDLDIRSFKAVGDGLHLNTRAIQAAIDSAHANAGGRVIIPPGTFLTGSLLLRSRVQLHLAPGATLLASPNRQDYSTRFHHPRDIGFIHERVGPEHLIYAREARDIAITGQGAIDGNGRAFTTAPAPGKFLRGVPGWRPGQLITFCNCQDVLLRDIKILDSSYWTIWPHGCKRVQIQGITITNDPRTPNSDGINPDSSQDVFISNCRFTTGDDCIAIRSDADRLNQPGLPSKNIVVNNCIMETPCCAIRIGYAGDAPISDCAFSNIVITNSRTGINMLVPHISEPQDGFFVRHGPMIQRITFNSIIMDTKIALYLWVGDHAGPNAGIHDIKLSNITASASRACYVGGAPSSPITSLSLSNFDLRLSGPMDDRYAAPPYPYPLFDDFTAPGIPHGFYARHARDLSFHNFTVRWGDIQGDWDSPIHLDHVENARFESLSAPPPPTRPNAPSIRHASLTPSPVGRGPG